MKKAKKFFVVFLCFVMIMLQCAPLQVFAEEVKSKSKILPTIEQEKDAHILGEVKDKRTEYTKTFILSDGSYCDVYSSVKLHDEVDGKLENVSSKLDNPGNTISDVKRVVSTLTNADANNKLNSSTLNRQGEQRSSCPWLFSTPETDYSLSFYAGNASVSSNNNTIVVDSSAKGIFIMTASGIDKYNSKNRVITKADLSFTVDYNSTGKTTIDAFCGNSTWQSTYPISPNQINTILLSSAELKNNNGISYNISFNLINWVANCDRGNGNYAEGVYFVAQSKKNFVLSNPVLTITYKSVGYNDANCTYHSIELGAAGKVLINDYTNTVTLEQNLIGIDINNLPVNIKKYSSSADIGLTSAADRYSILNYNSSLALYSNGNTYTAIWTLFDKSQKIFIRPANPVATNNMEEWVESSETQTSENPAILHIDSNAISSAGFLTNYSNCYIQFGVRNYRFDSNGNLSQITFGGKSINLSFTSNEITQIIDGNGNKYSLTYALSSNPNLNDPYLRLITVQDVNNQYIHFDSSNNPFEVNINWTFDSTDSTYCFVTTYADNTQLSVQYDSSGRIIGIEYGSKSVTFEYENGQNFLAKYIIQETNDLNQSTTTTVTINGSNIFRRIFIYNTNNSNEKADVIDYNEVGQVISSETVSASESNTNLVCYNYDNDGNLMSFAVEETNTDQLLYDGDMRTGDWSGTGLRFTEEEVIIPVSTGITTSMFQEEINLTAGKTYVLTVGAHCDNLKKTNTSSVTAYVIDSDSDNTLVSLPLFVGNGINVIDDPLNYPDGFINEGNEVKRILFTSAINTSATVYVTSENQDDVVYVDYVYLNEAKDSGYCSSIINNSHNTYNESGLLAEESIQNNSEQLVQSFKYKDGNIVELVDQNGVVTYYTYSNGLLTAKGTTKVNEQIENPVEYTYDAIGALESVSQTITILNSPSTTTTAYTYDYGQVSSVTFNEISYNFEYLPNGNIKSITQVNSNDVETQLINNAVDVNNNLIITYANGVVATCSYSSGKVQSINYVKNNETVLSYTYSYDSDGELHSISDNDCLLTEFTETGYAVYYKVNNSSIEIYNKSVGSDNNILETYYAGIYYETNANTQENEATEYNITEPVTVSVDENGLTNRQQLISSVKKNSSMATNHPEIDYSTTIGDLTDGFDRITNKSADFLLSIPSQQISYNSDVDESYSYKTLNEATPESGELSTTSNLVSQHNYTYTFNKNTTEELAKPKNYSYEYYPNGTLKLVLGYIGENRTDLLPIAYFEYDEAGRVSLEYKVYPEVCIEYKYDNYGNLIQKVVHDFASNDNSFVVRFFKFLYKKGVYTFTASYSGCNDDTFDIATVLSSTISDVNYTFDVYNKERLTGFEIDNETPQVISYDLLGQPNANYFYNVDGELTRAECEWVGNMLVSCTTDDARVKYTYDVNGYLSSKKMYQVQTTTDPNSGDPITSYVYNATMFYNWEDGVLQGMHFLSQNINNINEALYTDIIYDLNGEPIGIMVPSGTEYIFGKDYNGNITSLYSMDGEEVFNIYYDAFGTCGFTVGGSNWIEAIIYALTGLCNPSTYKGMLYDCQTGIYFEQGRCYSPFYGRYLNISNYNSLNKISKDANTNPYVFACNDPVNNSNNDYETDKQGNRTRIRSFGFETDMTSAFLSKSSCDLFTKAFLKNHGTPNVSGESEFRGLTSEEICSSLFAHAVGRYCEEALNRVNSVWSDGWLLANRNANVIYVDKYDSHYSQYRSIWNNAEKIKEYTVNKGLYIEV